MESYQGQRWRGNGSSPAHTSSTASCGKSWCGSTKPAVRRGVGKEAVKGGLLASHQPGVRALSLLPICPRLCREISQFVAGLAAENHQVDQAKRIGVAHRKEVLIAGKSEKGKACLWDSLVKSLRWSRACAQVASFGAFVDLGGVDGLMHIQT